MIYHIADGNTPIFAAAGLLLAFAATCALLTKCSQCLPKDAGRAFAHDGKLSAGKPRGAGIIFVFVFTFAAILFAEISREYMIYLILIVVEMLTGYMDDASEHPWNEYKKGILDLVVSIVLAVTYLNFHSSTFKLATLGMMDVTLPPVLFGVLTVILVWTSINVTNCADGVDGLSGTLVLITLGTIYIIMKELDVSESFRYLILLFGICILGYLWYNATPSRLMMGDAGSRAMGVFIAIAVLMSESPLLYIPVALVLILDGGLGLLKVALLRYLKIKILKNTRTPLHDHVRKNKGWSNTQTVFRFAIIQIVISLAVIYLIL